MEPSLSLDFVPSRVTVPPQLMVAVGVMAMTAVGLQLPTVRVEVVEPTFPALSRTSSRMMYWVLVLRPCFACITVALPLELGSVATVSCAAVSERFT